VHFDSFVHGISGLARVENECSLQPEILQGNVQRPRHSRRGRPFELDAEGSPAQI